MLTVLNLIFCLHHCHWHWHLIFCLDLSSRSTIGDIFQAQCRAGSQRGACTPAQQHGAHPVLHPELHPQLHSPWYGVKVYPQSTKWLFEQLKVYTFHSTSGSPSSGLKMQIVFKRRLTNELLTTYLPSLILILMCYATSFFKPIYFEAAVTVNLSILLVTTTLFIRFG